MVVVELDAEPDALALVGAFVATAPHTPVLTVTASADHAAVLAAVRAGAPATSCADVPVGAGRRRPAHGRGGGCVQPRPGRRRVGGVRPPARRPRGARQLTDREADVLRLVVEGLTARQIASRLVLSPRTVENHVQNVLRKLRLHSRAALVRYAIEHGLA
ncbi:hypothetical protein BJF78_21330 [Pseudonocardia sp. CNS-139]|nr:hypothetical protein BJF78_21330 [Pseudonocardia sp. CNS-139]